MNSEFMIAWNPDYSGGVSTKIKVGPWPDKTGWSDKYDYTDGMCFSHWQRASREIRTLLVFIAFNTCVVRDHIDPQAAHYEFLKIDEYRTAISPDMHGAAA